jgi:hypothetical protein
MKKHNFSGPDFYWGRIMKFQKFPEYAKTNHIPVDRRFNSEDLKKLRDGNVLYAVHLSAGSKPMEERTVWLNESQMVVQMHSNGVIECLDLKYLQDGTGNIRNRSRPSERNCRIPTA